MSTEDKNRKPTRLERILQREKVSEEEAIAAIRSARRKPGRRKSISIAKNSIRYGYFSDPHIGHQAFSEPLYDKMVRVFRDKKLDFVVNPGDHLEGMSGRPGHIYELTHIGYENQIKFAAQLYNQIPYLMFGIDGNHDQWYFKKNNGGAIVGDGLEARVNTYRNLGQDEGWLNVAPGIDIMLFHANDGTAYATSYKLQKLIESFSPDKIPAIVHSGHYHKALYMHLRGVHGFESGTLAEQTPFMRGRKLQAHMGFGIVEFTYNRNGVDGLTHTWYGFNPRNSKTKAKVQRG